MAVADAKELQGISSGHPLDGSEVTLGMERDRKVETIVATPQMTKTVDSGFVYNIYREKRFSRRDEIQRCGGAVLDFQYYRKFDDVCKRTVFCE